MTPTQRTASAEAEDGKFVVVVRPGRRTGPVLFWLRQLLPTAVMLVAPAGFQSTGSPDFDPIVVEADDIDSPMSLANELARRHAGYNPAG